MARSRISKAKREQAELILQHAATIQRIYWELIYDLEQILGCDVDSMTNFEGCNTQDLERLAKA